MTRRFLSAIAAVLLFAASCKEPPSQSAAPASLATTVPSAVPEAPITGRLNLSLDSSWRFHLGDITTPPVLEQLATYYNAKAGTAHGAADPNYDDSTWRELDLPHDWAVEGPFDPKANISQGYRPRGIAWYRRHFKLDPSQRGKHLELQFDGIATHATIWVNGVIAARNFCGYTACNIDISPLVKFGNEVNTIAVRVDAEQMEGWWYEGAGIYRATRIVQREPIHISTDGVFANPIKNKDGTWSIPAEVTLENSGPKPEPASIQLTVADSAGNIVAATVSNTEIKSLRSATVPLPLTVTGPQLWSLESPSLYTVTTTIRNGAGQVTDTAIQTCGFRTIRFDPNLGFFLNDKPVKLQGTCNHQDHAGLGTAIPQSIHAFRVRKLKEMGSNAFRCSHNPPDSILLDEFDRQGMLVMDENRNFNPTQEYQRQLEWLVRRDRNHPSVILWSVFNEEPMQGTEQGYEMARRMSAIVKALDPTRPVTAAMNDGQFNPLGVADAVDVVGFNYHINDYDRYHKLHPDRPLTSAEDTSAFATRGVFTTDRSQNTVDDYDSEAAGHGATHRAAWKAIADRPYLAGGFCWTGFDYRGEPSPYTWPSAGSFFGAMDLCGFPKTAFYMHQAMWIRDRPIVELTPHWTWPGREGQPIKVLAITNATSAELFLNNKSLGEKPSTPYDPASWSVPYQPGKLELVAKQSGEEIGRKSVETTGPPVQIKLTPDRDFITGDGLDALPITVQVTDAQGRPIPTANDSIAITIRGGKILGTGNGDPNNHDPEQTNNRRLFNGLAQIIVRATPGEHILQVFAESPGLKSGPATEIPIRTAKSRPSIASAERSPRARRH